jgi:methylaspartate ammonia-lyase
MKIAKVLYVPGYSSFFFDDQQAIKNGAAHDGFIYRGEAVTEGFSSIRQAGEALSVILLLENGTAAAGDCTAVQYSGAGGRDPLFLAAAFVPFLEKEITPLLEGRSIDTFRENADFFDQLLIEGKRLHTAVRYGLTQALLEATALSRGELKTETICREFGLPIIPEAVPLFGQCGDDRYAGVDKMILKGVDVLPHGLINSVDEKLGRKGEKLEEYISYLSERINRLKPHEGYRPELHIDIYGTAGLIFDQDPVKTADYLAGLEKSARGYPLWIEGPLDMGEKNAQIDGLKRVTDRLEALGSGVKIVADEWCNTLEDIRDFTDARCCHMVQIKTPDLGGVQNIVESVIYCNNREMMSYQGGTCNETDLSTRCCVHIALAARPRRMLVKPGMGFDEGMTLVHNEMARTIELLKLKTGENQ